MVARQLGHALAELLTGWNADDIAASIGTDPRLSEATRANRRRMPHRRNLVYENAGRVVRRAAGGNSALTPTRQSFHVMGRIARCPEDDTDRVPARHTVS